MLRALLLFLCLSSVGQAATLYADSAARDHVAAKIAEAAPGDTVVVPAGDFTWTEGLTVSKEIHLQGAGIGQTIIRRVSNGIIDFGSNVTVSIDGFEFHLDHTNTSGFILTIRGRDSKISNCKFVSVGPKIVATRWVGGTGIPHPSGVVWNCEFLGSRIIVQGDVSTSPTQMFGRKIWGESDDELAWGMQHTVFFEDNDFDANGRTGNLFDGEYGGHFVVRYNSIVGASVFDHGITSNSERGTVQVEVYHNTLHYEGTGSQDPPIRFRGGSALIWNNTVTGGWANWASGGTIMLDNELQRFGGYQPQAATTGTHDGSAGAATLTDSTKAWFTDSLRSTRVYNLTDGSSGVITANTATTITAVLTGGSDNQWDPGDSYHTDNGYMADGNQPRANGTGTHSGSSGAAVLTDGTKSWTVNEFAGNAYVWNLTDGSLGLITENTATTVTATLFRGTDNDWDAGDSYKITSGYPTRDQVGRGADSQFWAIDLDGSTVTQELRPVYQWGNTRDGSPVIDIVLHNNSGQWIQANRDYYNAEFSYTPYPYPHPLRGALAAPTFTVDPASATRTVGESVTFAAVAVGNPSPTYQWRKGGVNIGGATSASYTIAAVELSDAGTFDVVATNSEGVAFSASATLTVNAGGGGEPGDGSISTPALSVGTLTIGAP